MSERRPFSPSGGEEQLPFLSLLPFHSACHTFFMIPHIPVLLEETVQFFEPFPGGKFIDATVGYGGHTFAILERIPGSTVLGIDADASALAFVAEERRRRNISSDRLVLRQGNFRIIDALAEESGFARVGGILFDFGMS